MHYFDCHADTLTNIPHTENLLENTGSLDLRRVRKFADHYTQIFAIWQDRKAVQKQQTEQIFRQLYKRALKLLKEQSDSVAWCKDAADMCRAHEAGKAAAFLSVEDISIMGNQTGQLRELGIRFAILTWNYENAYACGAAADQSRGLTSRGRALVRELLQEQVVLDISHLSDQGVEDLLHMTDRPLMASHSNVRAVCGHPRNLTKNQIRELIARNGLMGLNFYKCFVGPQPGLTDFLRHIDAVLEMGGENILAIGSDFDGCSEFPDGITGVESIPGLRDVLEREGFGRKITDKIFFENARRFVLENVK